MRCGFLAPPHPKPSKTKWNKKTKKKKINKQRRRVGWGGPHLTLTLPNQTPRPPKKVKRGEDLDEVGLKGPPLQSNLLQTENKNKQRQQVIKKNERRRSFSPASWCAKVIAAHLWKEPACTGTCRKITFSEDRSSTLQKQGFWGFSSSFAWISGCPTFLPEKDISRFCNIQKAQTSQADPEAKGLKTWRTWVLVFWGNRNPSNSERGKPNCGNEAFRKCQNQSRAETRWDNCGTPKLQPINCPQTTTTIGASGSQPS